MCKNTFSTTVWDQTLIEKYNYSGPRYTSYPTALEFNDSYTEQDFISASQKYPDRALSLYVHIPFCHKLCYFCACNKIVTRQTQKTVEYLDMLFKEIEHRAPLFEKRVVTQLHFGGGTPTYLEPAQISALMAKLRAHFTFSADAEISIEIDPREIPLSILDHLRSEGFNRISIGIQDFNKSIQIAINRVQDEEFIAALIKHAKELNFNSINLDLIYGLPKQTTDSFLYTLEKIVKLDPDRLSIFNYAHLPKLFAAQRKIKDDDLPSPSEKLAILQNMIHFLTQSNYQYIGMDHFAKPDNELAIAQQNGVLHRNFQGYTTHEETDLLGFGVSAISILGDNYAQNQKELKQYYHDITEKSSALLKGLVMTEDDCIRNAVIKSLICNFKLDKTQIETRFGLHFDDYFAEDLQLLKPLENDNLLKWEGNTLLVSPTGRLLIRHICMCFDIYYRKQLRQHQFSRII